MEKEKDFNTLYADNYNGFEMQKKFVEQQQRLRQEYRNSDEHRKGMTFEQWMIKRMEQDED